jgi:serine/threonine-protein kinase
MGREVDGRSDIFSLGAMLYEMLTGHYAFDGDSLPTIVYRVINDTPVTASTLRPQLPAGLASLLTHMLSKNPHARPDARTLVDALHALAPAARQAEEPPPPNRIPRLLAILAFGAPAGVLLLIGVGIIVIEHFLPPAQPAAAPTPVVASPPAPAAGGPVSPPAAEPRAAEHPAPADVAEPDPYLAGLDKKRVELRIRRTELLLEYTERHPDVVQIDRQLEQLRVERRRYLRQRQQEKKNP